MEICLRFPLSTIDYIDSSIQEQSGHPCLKEISLLTETNLLLLLFGLIDELLPFLPELTNLIFLCRISNHFPGIKIFSLLSSNLPDFLLSYPFRSRPSLLDKPLSKKKKFLSLRIIIKNSIDVILGPDFERRGMRDEWSF